MRLKLVWGALGTLVVSAGCGSGGDSPSPESGSSPSVTPSAVTSASTSATPADQEEEFKPGDCATDPGNRKALVRVDCAKPHQLEVYAEYQSSATSFGQVAAEAKVRCGTAFTSFTGSEHHAGTWLSYTPGTPSAETWKDGKRRVICFGFAYPPRDTGNWSKRTATLRGVLAGAGAYQFRRCATGKASQTGELGFVACDRPHRSEGIPATALLGDARTPFPTRATLNARAGAACRPAVRAFLGASRDDVTAAWRFPTRTNWSNGFRYVICYAQVGTGTVTKSLRGIGQAPLSTRR